MTMTDDHHAEVEPPPPPPRGRTPLPKHPCFSGDGRLTRSRWASGGDTRYRERLRRAHRANRVVPDPWYIAEHGGVELIDGQWPEGGWPTMTPWEVATRLDAERVAADPYSPPRHWRDWLDFTELQQRRRAEKREANAAALEQSRRAATEDGLAQAARPQRGTLGRAYEDPRHPDVTRPARVSELADPQRMIVEFVDADGGQALIFDEMFERDTPVRVNAEPEGSE